MRLWFVALASIVELPLMAVHYFSPETPAFPLGGSDFMQHLILVSFAFWFEDVRNFVSESLRIFIRTIRGESKDRDEDR